MRKMQPAVLLSAVRPRIGLSASVVLIAVGALGGCDRGPVEEDLVGTWQSAVASPNGAVQMRFTALSNGQYRTEYQGAGAVGAETGYFEARGGEWRIEKLEGGIESGTYEFLSDDTVLFRTRDSAVVWNRVDGAAPSAESFAMPTGVPSGAPAAAGPAASGGWLGGLSASAVPSAASDAGAAAGAVSPMSAAPVAPAAGSATQWLPLPPGMPQPPLPLGVRKAAPSAVFVEPAALARGGGAVAGVVADVAAPAAEAADEAKLKAGERVQNFTSNAANRVRNFFTRGRNRDRDDEAEGSAETEP